MGKTLQITSSNTAMGKEATSDSKPLKPILSTREPRRKYGSEGDLPPTHLSSSDVEQANEVRRRPRSVTFCAPEDNEVYICPPHPGRPWTSKAKRFLAKFFTTHALPITPGMSPNHHGAVGPMTGVGILSF